jgi:hypothetical protein
MFNRTVYAWAVAALLLGPYLECSGVGALEFSCTGWSPLGNGLSDDFLEDPWLFLSVFWRLLELGSSELLCLVVS